MITRENEAGVCRESRGTVKREGGKDGERLTVAASVSVVGLGSLSLTDLRFRSYLCTFPANLPLLIKPGGVDFYYLQPTKPRVKQMRVYFQIIGPKRMEASIQATYL